MIYSWENYYFVSLVHKDVFLLCLFEWFLEVSDQEHENENEVPTLSLFYRVSTTENSSFNLSHLSGVSPQNHQLKDYNKCLNSFGDLKDQ